MEQLDRADAEVQSPSRIKFLRDRGKKLGESWWGPVGASGDFSSAPCQYDPRGKMSRLEIIDRLKSSAKGRDRDPTL